MVGSPRSEFSSALEKHQAGIFPAVCCVTASAAGAGWKHLKAILFCESIAGWALLKMQILEIPVSPCFVLH